MTWRDVERHAQQVDAVLVRARSRPVSDDPELQADLAKYACVLVSGYLEQSIRSIFVEVTRRRASAEVHSYVARRLKFLRNTKSRDIVQLAGDFDAGWRIGVDDLLEDERKAAIDSVVNNRNGIAHGQQINIGLVQIGLYFAAIRSFVRDLAILVGVLSPD